jgi:hypothetical protein
MSYKFLAATSATILALAISIPTTLAQTADASKKKIQNITNYNAVQPSTGTAKAPVVFTQPRVNHTDLRTAAPPSPPTANNPGGGWRGPTNNPARVVPSTTTYHAPASTTTYRAAATPPARVAPVTTTTPAKKP